MQLCFLNSFLNFLSVSLSWRLVHRMAGGARPKIGASTSSYCRATRKTRRSFQKLDFTSIIFNFISFLSHFDFFSFFFRLRFASRSSRRSRGICGTWTCRHCAPWSATSSGRKALSRRRWRKASGGGHRPDAGGKSLHDPIFDDL